MTSLDDELLKAHEVGEGKALAALYAKAADVHKNEPERAAFYLTHAYVFTLEAGLPEAQDYHKQLKSWGREE